MNLAVRRGFPFAIRCRDHHRQAACRDQIAAIVIPNDGISRAAIVAATAFKRIPLMCTRDR
jgi:hypothetical protein